MVSEFSQLKTKVWQVPELDNMELFLASSICHTYTRHSHATFAIGAIKDGVGGNFYRGSTYLAPRDSVILMNSRGGTHWLLCLRSPADVSDVVP